MTSPKEGDNMSRVTFEVCEKCGKRDDKMQRCDDCRSDSVCRYCNFCNDKDCFEYKD